ncbi:MAG: transposase domain-containing protein [Opitutales bacterium]
MENYRLAGVDPEAYLIDILARVDDHPAFGIAELTPRAWAKSKARNAGAADVFRHSVLGDHLQRFSSEAELYDL